MWGMACGYARAPGRFTVISLRLPVAAPGGDGHDDST
jgi:hypothetical protein